jgi:hypothetical protein
MLMNKTVDSNGRNIGSYCSKLLKNGFKRFDDGSFIIFSLVKDGLKRSLKFSKRDLRLITVEKKEKKDIASEFEVKE